MRIILITQQDVFFLPEVIKELIESLHADDEIISAICLQVSPYGKKESFIRKAFKTLYIFGFRFFIYYTSLYVYRKFIITKTVNNILKNKGIKILHINGNVNSQKNLRIIEKEGADLAISIGSNQIFKEEFLSLFPKGCLNLHSSLLPKNRGLLPSFWALKNGDDKSGVSVFFVDKGIDSGPILIQKEVDLRSMSQKQLIEASKAIGVKAILESFAKIKIGNIQTLENNDSLATYNKFPTRRDVKEFRKNGRKFF